MRHLVWICALSLLSLGGIACADDENSDSSSSATSSNGSSSDDVGVTSGADTDETLQPDTNGEQVGLDTPPDTSGPVDLDMQPEDFTCIRDWDQVRRFRVTNLLGGLEETLAVANNPYGGTYPPGTVIQLVPTEAMVKRQPGWSPETIDWEFFLLEANRTGTTIVARGTRDVINAFGGNCFDCHAKAEPQWDLVCEQDHGCDPIPIGAELIQTLQESDPRCP
ncbi:MAG: hypothetical protein AAFX99_30125 [Myxococcota bacterium]